MDNNTKLPAVQNSSTSLQFNESEVELIKNTVAKGASDMELKLFISQCQRTGLDPLSRQIYFMKGKPDKQGNPGKITIITAIDGFRLIADRSSKYQGQTTPQWCGPDGVWKDIWLSSTPPSASKIGIYKEGFKEPLYAVAIFSEYVKKSYDGKPEFMWAKMPALMIAKVAESLALRKAFPNETSGIYTKEEMTHADFEDDIPAKETAKEKVIEVQATEVESPEKKAITEALGKLKTQLDSMNLDPDSRKAMLHKTFMTWNGADLAKLSIEKLEAGIAQIKTYVDPADGSLFPTEQSEDNYDPTAVDPERGLPLPENNGGL